MLTSINEWEDKVTQANARIAEAGKRDPGLDLSGRQVTLMLTVNPTGKVADAIKNFFKEDLVPDHVDKFLYTVAPLLALVPPLLMAVASYVTEPVQMPLPHLVMPAHHDVREDDVVMRRLRGTLAAAASRGRTSAARPRRRPL